MADIEKKMEELGARVRNGNRAMHQISQKALDAVREAVKANWHARAQIDAASESITEEQSRTQSKAGSHSQSH